MAAKEWSSGLAPEARLLHWYLCLCRVAIHHTCCCPFLLQAVGHWFSTPSPSSPNPETSVLGRSTQWACQTLLTVSAVLGPFQNVADPCCPLIQAQLTLCYLHLYIPHLFLHLSFWKWALSLWAPSNTQHGSARSEQLTE